MKSTKREPLKFAPRPNPREIECEQRQRDFLRFLAQGESIHDACALLGITRHAYEKWRNRHDEFPAAVAAARESHRRDIACGFPNAAAPACIALGLLEASETEETRFHQRTAALRKEHEAAQDRLEARLSTVQQRREARSFHAALRILPTVRVQPTMRGRGMSAHPPTTAAAT